MAEPKNTERKVENDILKAIGIISIVVGHTVANAYVHDFVYSYHLALFLFISGLQINISKYDTNPFLLVSNRLRSMWPGFFGYMSLFTLTHNAAVLFHLLPEEGRYSSEDIAARLLNNYLFLGSETLGAALWFVPVILVALFIFASVLYFSTRYFRRHRLIPIGIVCSVIGLFGIHYNINNIYLPLHLQTALILLPILFVGFTLRSFQIDFHRFFQWYLAIPCLLLLLWLLFEKRYIIELSMNLIGSPFFFYPISLCGIYFIGFIAKQLARTKYISRIFSFIGRYSFDIMALHFGVIKVIDVIYGSIISAKTIEISIFPYAFPSLWPVYLICCILFIPVIRITFGLLCRRIKAAIPGPWSV